jgi:PAS domain S-box-containing protein
VVERAWREELLAAAGVALRLDADGRVLDGLAAWSEGLAELAAPAAGEPFAAALVDVDDFSAALARAAVDGRAEVELRGVCVGGGARWIRCCVVALADGFAALVEDVDGRRRRVAELDGAAARLESFVDNTADAFIAHDMNGRLVDVNKAMCEAVGYSREELLNMHVYDVELTVQKGSIRGIWSRMTPGIPVTIEGRHRRRDGTIFPVEVRLGLFGEGESARVMALCRDITERKRAEAAREELNAELARARDAAVKANQAKSEFLANMSHELRTPLNAIIGYTELVADDLAGFEADVLRPDLDKIHGAAIHLLGLINDILDISKIEAGRFDVDLEEVDVEALADRVGDVVRPLAERNYNTLVVRCEGDIGAIRTDRVKLRQVLINLLSNACKFTEDGSIELVARRVGERLRIAVKDSGIGIPEGRLEVIFDAFTQADSSTTRKYGGTGLGLALTRRFCHMLGGDVTVESVVGEGSTFTVDLPVWLRDAEVAASVASAAADRSRPGADESRGADAAEAADADDATSSAVPEVDLDNAPVVLVIDDDPAAHDLIARFLVREGVRIRSAYNAREGIAHARAYRPAVILLDIVMPEIDGWAALRTLKGDPALAKIPVVLSSIAGEEERALSLGASDYLLKPIDREALLCILNRHAPGKEGTVLVVDDDPAAREVFRRTLRQTGWRVLEAVHGRDAIERLEAAKEPVDVVVLDLMMPEMDGFEVVERLRLDPRWRSLPVVIASAMDLTERERALLRGRVEGIYRKGSLSVSSLSRELARLAHGEAKATRPS